MAAPNLTLTRFPFRDLTAQAKIASGDGAGPASYLTGGEVVVLADLGLSQVWDWMISVATNGTNIYIVRYRHSTGALQWWDPSTKAEVPNATDLSGFTYTFFVTGQ